MKQKSILMWAMLLAFCTGFVFTSCSSDDDSDSDNPDYPYYGNSYAEVLQKDNAAIIAKYPHMEGRFLEARYELNDNVNTTLLKDLKADKVTYIYDYEHKNEGLELLTAERNFEHGFGLVINSELEDSPWLEDDRLTTDILSQDISLEEVLRLVKESNYPQPETKYVTLRMPVDPRYYNTDKCYYVFGGKPNRQFDIYVEAINGKVICQEN